MDSDIHGSWSHEIGGGNKFLGSLYPQLNGQIGSKKHANE